MECATCGIAPCDLPCGVDPDDVFVTDEGVTNCIPCATGHSLVVTFTSDGTDGDRDESHCPTPCDDDCDAPCHEEHQPVRRRTHAPDSHGDDLPDPNPYTGEGHGTQAQEG